ncbi:hypothetical protein ACFO9Q_18305 [Paenibacillus sp. GCM10023252]
MYNWIFNHVLLRPVFWLILVLIMTLLGMGLGHLLNRRLERG